MAKNGGSLYLRGTNIKITCNVHLLRNGDYKAGNYLYCDDILTHVKKKKTVNGYTYFLGKIPGRNVVFDGKNYARCDDWREGIRDLIFKSANDRGSGQYKNVSFGLSPRLFTKDWEPWRHAPVITRYIVTRSSTLISVSRDTYTVKEAIELTRGQYGGERFEWFFTER